MSKQKYYINDIQVSERTYKQYLDKEFKRLKKHLRVKHDMNLYSYKRMYPNAPLVDPEYSKEMQRYGNTDNLIPIKKGEKRALKHKKGE